MEHGLARSGIDAGAIETLRLPSVEFGPYRLAPVRVSTTGPDAPFRQSASEAVGAVGAGLLKPFVVTIDYQAGAVHRFMPRGG